MDPDYVTRVSGLGPLGPLDITKQLKYNLKVQHAYSDGLEVHFNTPLIASGNGTL